MKKLYIMIEGKPKEIRNFSELEKYLRDAKLNSNFFEMAAVYESIKKKIKSFFVNDFEDVWRCYFD